MNRTVPSKYAHKMLRVAEAQGYDPAELVASLDLALDPLQITDPEQPIPASIYTRIYTQVMWLLEDESFGLSLKQRTPAGTFRMMCLCMIHCRTLGDALRRAAEFNAFCRRLTGAQPIAEPPLSRLDDGSAQFAFPANQEMVAGDALYTMAHCMAIWRRLCGWLIGRPLDLLSVSFQAGQPEDPSELQELFRCPMLFGQPRNALRLPDTLLVAPLAQNEQSLREFLRNAPYYLLVANEEDDGSLLAQMRRIIGGDLSQDFPTVLEMAGQLNMSVRTLRRRLKEYGTTYQEFKDELRRSAAARLLRRPELKINAISALLGFDEPSAFHRSFKKWTGLTPGEYRVQRIRDNAGSPAHTAAHASDA